MEQLNTGLGALDGRVHESETNLLQAPTIMEQLNTLRS
jgi:hypothetical protein